MDRTDKMGFQVDCRSARFILFLLSMARSIACARRELPAPIRLTESVRVLWTISYFWRSRVFMQARMGRK